MTAEEFIALCIFLALNFAAAASGAVFKPGDWYENLNHPPWRAPNWVFPVVWTVLYIAMGVAGWMVWKVAGLSGASAALTIYCLHLVLNAFWSAVFFGMQRIDLALYEVAALWSSLVAVIALFYAIEPVAAYLLLPYLAWATFAAYLNWVMLKLNPTSS